MKNLVVLTFQQNIAVDFNVFWRYFIFRFVFCKCS